MVEGWLIVEVGFFEVSPGNHRSDGYFCASTFIYKLAGPASQPSRNSKVSNIPYYTCSHFLHFRDSDHSQSNTNHFSYNWGVPLATPPVEIIVSRCGIYNTQPRYTPY